MELDYDQFIEDFDENYCIKTRENTKRETTVRIGSWKGLQVAFKNCYREREATVYDRISTHPNIVKLLGVIKQVVPEKTKPRIYILMEADCRLTLGDCTQIFKYNLRHVLYIMIEITKGLGHLHNSGIIHNDIKCDNILMMGEQEQDLIKICDFGLSAFAVDITEHNVDKFRTSGTKGYSAPEKTRNSTMPFTNKVDIYAIGVLGSTLANNNILTEDIEQYNKIIGICKAENPDDRYTAGQLLEQLVELYNTIKDNQIYQVEDSTSNYDSDSGEESS